MSHQAALEVKAGQYLGVDGANFVYNGERVYLSGTNTAWIYYGSDFGNNAWDGHGHLWVEELGRLGAAGANHVRVWVHVEGDVSPLYNDDGYVVGTDSAGSLVSDLTSFLDECAANNILAGLVLFNGAVLRNKKTINLFWDDSKLTSYLDTVLVPVVRELKDHPALAYWEVMNEPEGSSPAGQTDSEPCFDFTHLDWSKSGGPGWSGADIPIWRILRLHNWVADAIHREDGKALVSAGSWSSLASTSIAGDDPVHKAGFNHYSDDCLLKAGQRELGVVDFIQFHTYPWAGSWGSHNPLSGKSPADYGVDKPILVGEFPAAAYEADGLPNGDSTAQVVEYLYTRDFAGGLSWAYIPDEFNGHGQLEQDVLDGIEHLNGRSDHGKVNINVN